MLLMFINISNVQVSSKLIKTELILFRSLGLCYEAVIWVWAGIPSCPASRARSGTTLPPAATCCLWLGTNPGTTDSSGQTGSVSVAKERSRKTFYAIAGNTTKSEKYSK